MLLRMFSLKGVLATALLATSGVGAVAMVHANAHATQQATPSSTSTATTSGSSTTTTPAASGVNQGLSSGASLRGQCIAWSVRSQHGQNASLKRSHETIELYELATSKGTTVQSLCAPYLAANAQTSGSGGAGGSGQTSGSGGAGGSGQTSGSGGAGGSATMNAQVGIGVAHAPLTKGIGR